MSQWKPASGVLVVGVIVLLVFSLGASAPADARVRFFPIPNATADEAVITPTGEAIVVTGGIKCTEGEIVEINVTVTQETTGAVAEGTTFTRCLGTETQARRFIVHAPMLEQTPFETGNARVEVTARTLAQGTETHAWSWENDATLVRHYSLSQIGEHLRDFIDSLF